MSHAAKPCMICQSKKNYYDFSVHQFRVEECASCRMIRLHPQPTDKQLSALDKPSAARLPAPELAHYLACLSAYTHAPLKGALLLIAEAVEEQVRSMTPPEGLSLRVLTFEQASFNLAPFIAEEKKFNYIIGLHVVEKSRQPRELLQQLHALLSKDGVLMLQTTLLDLPEETRLRQTKTILTPYDFWYFSKTTFQRLCYSEHFGALNYQPLRPKSGASLVTMTKHMHTYAPKKLSVVMAAFNEEKTLQATIDRVLAKKLDNLVIELIVVESASTDNTQTMLKQYSDHPRVKLVWQEKPQGKGNAIREGFAQLTGDFVLIQDADDEYDIEDYDALIEPLVSGEAAFVLGARHGGRAWKMRQFSSQRSAGHFLNMGHWIFTALVNQLFRLHLKDPFTMFKVFRADCLRGLTFECNRFDFDYELLIKLVRKGYVPIEIPVNYRARSFHEGKKVRVFRDPLTWIRAMLKFRFQKVS